MKDDGSAGKAEPFRTVLRQSRSINPAFPVVVGSCRHTR